MIKEDIDLPVATAEKYTKNKERWRKNVNTACQKLLSVVCN